MELNCKPQSKSDIVNGLSGNLLDYDCPICKNKGVIYYGEDAEHCYNCECMAIRATLKRIKKSGLSQQMSKCTFDNFKTETEFQKMVKADASNYLSDHKGKWFFMGGQVGCGKTHICTAIVQELIKQGNSAKYMQWREDITKIKSFANTDEYSKLIEPFKKSDVLYIDDLYKTEQGKKPTQADINVAFEILNYRYNNCNNLITIISSEKTIGEMIDIDEAIGSRIFEMSKGYCLSIKADKTKNYRLR